MGFLQDAAAVPDALRPELPDGARTWRLRWAAHPRNSARIPTAAASEGARSVAPLGSAEPAHNSRLLSPPAPLCGSIPVHSDLLKPPEDAAAEARMLLPVTPRPQQPVRPARSVRMPPFHPRAHLERRCAAGLAGSAAPPACR